MYKADSESKDFSVQRKFEGWFFILVVGLKDVSYYYKKIKFQIYYKHNF